MTYKLLKDKVSDDVQCDCEVCTSRANFDVTKMKDLSELRGGRERGGSRNFTGAGRRLGDWIVIRYTGSAQRRAKLTL